MKKVKLGFKENAKIHIGEELFDYIPSDKLYSFLINALSYVYKEEEFNDKITIINEKVLLSSAFLGIKITKNQEEKVIEFLPKPYMLIRKEGVSAEEEERNLKNRKRFKNISWVSQHAYMNLSNNLVSDKDYIDYRFDQGTIIANKYYFEDNEVSKEVRDILDTYSPFKSEFIQRNVINRYTKESLNTYYDGYTVFCHKRSNEISIEPYLYFYIDEGAGGRVMFNVLVVDDEKEIRDAIEIYLRGENLNVFKAEDGLQALDILEQEKIHLIILDVMMPKLDGIRTCLKIRETQNLPIIMLSAKGEDSDKILGLNVGAEDYVTKPFNHLESVARVKSQLRRYEKQLEVENKECIRIRDLVIDTFNKKVTVRGENVKVTATEYKILHLFVSNPGRIFSIKEIYENVDPIIVHFTYIPFILRPWFEKSNHPMKKEYLSYIAESPCYENFKIQKIKQPIKRKFFQFILGKKINLFFAYIIAGFAKRANLKRYA